MKKIKPYLTLADIQWFKSEFIPDLAEAVQKKLEKNIDKMTSSLDKLVGEVKGYREEQALVSGKISEHTEQLDDHDTRIKQAEKTLNLRPTSS